MTAASLCAVEGGRSVSVLLWVATLERRAGEVIQAHIREHPRQGPSQVRDDLLKWSYGLLQDAEERENEAASIRAARTSRRRGKVVPLRHTTVHTNREGA